MSKATMEEQILNTRAWIGMLTMFTAIFIGGTFSEISDLEDRIETLEENCECNEHE